MDRAKYNTCMRPYIEGKGKSKEQRKLDFCTGAKICSQKASSQEEAIRLCSLPKPPKPPKVTSRARGKSCEKEVGELTTCVMNYFDKNNLYKEVLNINGVEIAIENALLECRCQS